MTSWIALLLLLGKRPKGSFAKIEQDRRRLEMMSTDLQIDQMTIEEKLRVMEALWDALCRHDAVPVEEWHKEILDERQSLIEEGKAESVDWETAKKRITERVS